MTDGCGRTIDYLRLSVTDRCNYRCRYCMPEAGVCKREHRDMLSFEELFEVASACVRCGVRKIRLTGGEPLVRRGLQSLMDWKAQGFSVQGEAGDGEEALEALLSLRPDIVLLDVRMPGMSGV